MQVFVRAVGFGRPVVEVGEALLLLAMSQKRRIRKLRSLSQLRLIYIGAAGEAEAQAHQSFHNR